jgi:predicted  nucleic acid-binding Zn-ribbon protein
MRIDEITATTGIKPLTPQQSRIAALKQQIERNKQNLNAERERQRKQREQQRVRKAQASINTLERA